jgi:hypothetical protein
MKRSPALQTLSRDHHTALLLTKACTRAAESGDEKTIAAICARVEQVFGEALAPHFKLEEEKLLPRMKAAGELALVKRTIQEHAHLRAMVQNISHHGDAAALATFASLLASHVRFEERELFVTVEQLFPLLSHDFLDD